MPNKDDARGASQSNTNKGWMIGAITLAVVLIVGGAFAAMIIAKGNRDTNRLSEVETELKDKETKIEELEKQISKTPAGAAEDRVSVDIDSIKEIIAANEKIPVEKIILNSTIITTQGEQKNIVLGTSVGVKGSSGFYTIYYKENTPGSEWKKVSTHHQLTCSSLSANQKAILKDLFYCVDEDMNTKVIGYD